MNISFHKEYVAERERELVLEAMEGGKARSRIRDELKERFTRLVKADTFIFTSSCSLGLEMACLGAGLGPGDEVILSTYQFPSAANAVLLTGATPVLCDVEEESPNSGLEKVAQRLTRRTAAIIVMHYGGVSVDLQPILELAKERGLWVIEDAAQGIGAHYKGRHLGTLGDFGAFSFHSTKNVSCGVGGALITSKRSAMEDVERMQQYGTDRGAYLRGETGFYAWRGPGRNGTLPPLCQAMLSAQLADEEAVRKRRLTLCRLYKEGLSALAEEGRIALMEEPPYAGGNGHLFYIRSLQMPGEDLRAGLLALGVDARTHFYPLHLSPMGRLLGYRRGDFPNGEEIFRQLLRLPLYPDLEEKEVEYVCRSMEKVLRS